jgi:hypothetical protein
MPTKVKEPRVDQPLAGTLNWDSRGFLRNYHVLFYVAWPMWAACLARHALSDLDTRWVLKKPAGPDLRARGRQLHGRDALGLDGALEQVYALVAQASGRSKEHLLRPSPLKRRATSGAVLW